LQLPAEQVGCGRRVVLFGGRALKLTGERREELGREEVAVSVVEHMRGK
jgi:hypothetical protein